MKYMIRTFGLAVAFMVLGFAAAPVQAASCGRLDSGQPRPQFMLDRMPECGGSQPAVASAKTAGSPLTTLFAADNSGTNTGGVYFDLEAVGADTVTITSWETSLNAGFTGDVSIWYHAGGYSGFETSSSGWNLVGTATGVSSAGTDVPTPVNVGSLVIPAGTTYGIAITLSPANGSGGSGHNYTNGTGSNQVYNDGVLELRAGSANNIAFSSSLFSPRVWNGAVYYNSAPAIQYKPVPAIGQVGLAILLLLFAGIGLAYLRRQHHA